MNFNVAARLAILEARADISQLMSEYLRLVDQHADGDRIGALFTEDAVWTPGGRLATENFEVHGRKNLRELFNAVPTSLPFTVHYVMNEEIHVAEDAKSATGTWQALELMTINADERMGAVVMIAEYQNSFVRFDGRWLLDRVFYEDKVAFPWRGDWNESRYVSFRDLAVHPWR